MFVCFFTVEAKDTKPKKIDVPWRYGGWAFKKCKELVRERFGKKASLNSCDELQESVEWVLDTTGVNMANGIDSWSQVQETAMKDPWKKEGERIIMKTLHWLMEPENRKNNKTRIIDYFQRDFQQWFLDVCTKHDRTPKLPEGWDMEMLQRKLREADEREKREREEAAELERLQKERAEEIKNEIVVNEDQVPEGKDEL